jgi:iron complex transport system permease protein
MLVAMLLVFCLELALGPVRVPLDQVISILFNQTDVSEGWRKIVLLYRLPRAVTAALAGAALGAAGLSMQTLFRNPLADPYVLGVSAGAHLGVALLVLSAGGLGISVLGEKGGLFGNASLVLAAATGASGVLAVVLAVSRRVSDNVTLLVVGLMFGYVSGALVNILMQFTLEHQMQVYIVWTFGSFGQVTWKQLAVFTPAVLSGIALSAALIKPLNALLLGGAYARSMGLDVRRARLLVIIQAAVLAGSVTAYCGPIGFLGIAIPHLARTLLRTSDHRILMPGVILLGCCLALTADLLAQMPGGKSPLPLNAVTALIGAPVVIGVILKRQAEKGS